MSKEWHVTYASLTTQAAYEDLRIKDLAKCQNRAKSTGGHPESNDERSCSLYATWAELVEALVGQAATLSKESPRL